MNLAEQKLQNAPIVEAVLDIDCDMPPTFDLLTTKDAAFDRFRDQYPKPRQAFIQQAQVEAQINSEPHVSVQHGIHALQFLHEDEKQLVQIRSMGYSFNRLAPYTGLDDYLPEIESTWRLFIELTSPVQIRAVRLRYINRMFLPFVSGRMDLDDYLKIGPRLPDEDSMSFRGFFYQYSLVEPETGNEGNVVLTTEPHGGEMLPVIFDIGVAKVETAVPDDWDWISAKIQSLRALKNRIFRNTLTERCLRLFQPNQSDIASSPL